ncbi:MAG TPA: C40 family peptidase [Bacillales bacterium]|nr:C40 family peptidase [Bacillales bacterium]
MSSECLVNVNVATLWTTPESPREMDRAMLSSPARPMDWLNGMTVEDRRELSGRNLVQSQVLYGQTVKLLEEQGDWVKVAVPDQPSSKDSRGYPAWMPLEQLSAKPSNRKEKIFASVTVSAAILYNEQKFPFMLVSYATRLPYLRSEGRWVQVDTPHGSLWLQKTDVKIVNDQPMPTTGEDFIAEACSFVGLPYLWGGMSGFGFDCSGFCYTILRVHGYTIPRDASDQAREGKKIALTAAAPGDLLYFADQEGEGSVHHVGFYAGESKMLHAPHTGKAIESIALEGTIYERELCAVRRFH